MKVILVALMLAQTAGALELSEPALKPYEFTDAADDVTRNGKATNVAGAAANDILVAGVEEVGNDLHFWLELTNLSVLADEADKAGFHAQYALSFVTPDTTDGYSMRASYSGADQNPLGAILSPWNFQLHDRDDDTWTTITGAINGDRIEWTIAPAVLGLADDDSLLEWTATSWNSYDNEDQTNDRAQGSLGYIIGEGAIMPAGIAPGVGSGLIITDDEGDVETRGDPYVGEAAEATDAFWVGGGNSGNRMIFTLALASLAEISSLDDEPGYHVQYAVSFTTPDGDVYSLRADYRGQDMSNGEPGWNFQIHDHANDEWPGVPGSVDGDQLVWAVEKSMFGVEDGDLLSDWGLQTWAAFDDRDQFGDWASSGSTYKVGSGAQQDDGNSPQSNDGFDEPQSLEEAPGLGLLATLALLGVIAAIRRR